MGCPGFHQSKQWNTFTLLCEKKKNTWTRKKQQTDGRRTPKRPISELCNSCLIKLHSESSLQIHLGLISTKVCLGNMLSQNCKIWVIACEELTHPPYCEHMLRGLPHLYQENGWTGWDILQVQRQRLIWIDWQNYHFPSIQLCLFGS